MNDPVEFDDLRGGLLRRWRLIALLVALLVVLIGSLLIAPLNDLLAAL